VSLNKDRNNINLFTSFLSIWSIYKTIPECVLVMHTYMFALEVAKVL